ncbi:hypothetical protein [Sporosarcina sp. A2]|uniref:hypothetical protein n=1 Tax=Sporosarcina sp. A2 TaxID=3393449 RepID=UPI003D798584
MKKLILVICMIVLLGIAYAYQTPILDTNVAIEQAKKHLVTPPKEWQASFPKEEDGIVAWEVNKSVLTKRQGFWNGFTNKRNWEVTLVLEGSQVTLVMNATTGKLLDIYGSLN